MSRNKKGRKPNELESQHFAGGRPSNDHTPEKLESQNSDSGRPSQDHEPYNLKFQNSFVAGRARPSNDRMVDSRILVWKLLKIIIDSWTLTRKIQKIMGRFPDSFHDFQKFPVRIREQTFRWASGKKNRKRMIEDRRPVSKSLVSISLAVLRSHDECESANSGAWSSALGARFLEWGGEGKRKASVERRMVGAGPNRLVPLPYLISFHYDILYTLALVTFFPPSLISAAHCGSRLYTCAADADVLSLSLDLSQMHSSQCWVGWYGHTGLLYTHPLLHFYYKSLCSAWVSSTVILAYSSPTASFPVHYGPIDFPLSLSWLTCFSSGWLNEGRCPGGRPSVSYNKWCFRKAIKRPFVFLDAAWLKEGCCPGGRPSVSYDKTSFFLSLAAPDLEEKLAVHVQKA